MQKRLIYGRPYTYIPFRRDADFVDDEQPNTKLIVFESTSTYAPIQVTTKLLDIITSKFNNYDVIIKVTNPEQLEPIKNYLLPSNILFLADLDKDAAKYPDYVKFRLESGANTDALLSAVLNNLHPRILFVDSSYNDTVSTIDVIKFLVEANPLQDVRAY